MNILGHSYVAVQAVSGNRGLLITGALLPESSPFISGNPFVWAELHKGIETFLEFLDKNYKEKRDLALGMMAHSADLGADKFNKEIERYASFQREKILKEIVDCSDVDLRTAKWRLHNFLWWGVDLLILNEFPKFVGEVQNVLRNVSVEEISELLAKAFKKDRLATKAVVENLFRKIYQPEDLTSFEGIARIWARQAAGLPERDKVDVPKAADVIQKCAYFLSGNWRNFVESIVVRVHENLKSFMIEKGGRKTTRKLEI